MDARGLHRRLILRDSRLGDHQVQLLPDHVIDIMIPVTYGYARVSRTDDGTRNPETRLHILEE